RWAGRHGLAGERVPQVARLAVEDVRLAVGTGAQPVVTQRLERRDGLRIVEGRQPPQPLLDVVLGRRRQLGDAVLQRAGDRSRLERERGGGHERRRQRETDETDRVALHVLGGPRRYRKAGAGKPPSPASRLPVDWSPLSTAPPPSPARRRTSGPCS